MESSPNGASYDCQHTSAKVFPRAWHCAISPVSSQTALEGGCYYRPISCSLEGFAYGGSQSLQQEMPAPESKVCNLCYVVFPQKRLLAAIFAKREGGEESWRQKAQHRTPYQEWRVPNTLCVLEVGLPVSQAAGCGSECHSMLSLCPPAPRHPLFQ